MTDLGRLRYVFFLGLEVAYSPRGVLLSQKKYTSDQLSRAAVTDQIVLWSCTLSCVLLMDALTLLNIVSLLVALSIYI